ncbi:MAG TPA: response regulator [Bdellovibrionota bacterium]|nr:response regulator [Bdellovibrionota bacterium]
MKKILVADDSLTIQKVIRLALSNESYEIQAVSDGKEALQQVSLFRPQVVLIDVSLPVHTAFEIKRKVNQSPDLKDTQFILMSSAFEQVDESQAAEVGFAGRLVKPFDPGNLREILQRVMAQTSDDAPAPAPARAPFPERAPTAGLGAGGGISLTPPDPKLVPQGVSMDEDEDEEEDATRSLEPEQFPEPPPYTAEDENTRPAMSAPGKGISQEKTIQIDMGADDHQDGGFVIQDSARATEAAQNLSTDLWAGTAPSGGSNEDIRQLTESTIKLSGLDDFQWSVNDAPAKRLPQSPAPAGGGKAARTMTEREPTLEPPRNLLDTGGSTFQLPPLGATSEARGFYEQAPEQPPSYMTAMPAQPAFGAPSSFSAPAQPAPGLTVGSLAAVTPGAEMLALDPQEIDALVRKHVQTSLEKLARQLLPDIAERVLKEEIHKLLSSAP